MIVSHIAVKEKRDGNPIFHTKWATDGNPIFYKKLA